MLKPGTKVEEFVAPALVGQSRGELKWSDYKGKWTALVFYPFDFTGICGSELKAFHAQLGDFEKRGCKVIGASCDSVFAHEAWTKGELGAIGFPIVGDATKQLASRFGVLNEQKGCAYRAAFVIDPEGVIRAVLANDLPVGRSTDEVLRLVDAFQTGQPCKVNWRP